MMKIDVLNIIRSTVDNLNNSFLQRRDVKILKIQAVAVKSAAV